VLEELTIDVACPFHYRLRTRPFALTNSVGQLFNIVFESAKCAAPDSRESRNGMARVRIASFGLSTEPMSMNTLRQYLRRLLTWDAHARNFNQYSVAISRHPSTSVQDHVEHASSSSPQGTARSTLAEYGWLGSQPV
jgi:hypothetical protein